MSYRILVVLLTIAVPSAADIYERQPDIDVLHYDIALELSDANDSIHGTARIQVKVRGERVSGMWLDFDGMTVDSLRVADKVIPFTHRDGRLSFALSDLRRRIFAVEVRYHGTPGKSGLLITRNRHSHRVFFAENWPDHAHLWFPCIDHPHDKATVDFAITAPAQYIVVANGRAAGTKPLANGRKLTRWSEDVPIPTYCMVFGGAEFGISEAGRAANVPLLYYFYPEDTRNAGAKFARSNRVLDYFANLIGPYPFEKLAQVEATTLIGGMENASAIFYAEASFQGSLVSESPVPHEIAHQWFGDSITAADWDHLWLSEGFATYFDALFYEHEDGPAALKQRMESAAEAIEKLDQKQPGPVVDPAVQDPGRKLNAYNYEKGAWILHMLRGLIGDRAFFDGIRLYYRQYAGKTALTVDFARVMETAGRMPLDDFFRQWLTRPGRPHYRVSWNWNPDSREVELVIRQTQAAGLYDMPLEILLRSGELATSQKLRIFKETQSFRIPAPDQPTSVEIDPGGWVLKTVTIDNP